MTYEEFRDKIGETLKNAEHALTWTEVRTTTGLPQMFPNNQWVRRLEQDINLYREKDKQGIIHWQLKGS